MKLGIFLFGIVIFFNLGCGSKNNPAGIEFAGSHNIINGIEVSKFDPVAKYTVLVQFYEKIKNEDPKPTKTGLCTGVIVGKKTILTAAHCFKSTDSNKKKVIEIYFTQSADKLSEEVKGQAYQYIVHPHYVDAGIGSRHFDLAMVNIVDPIPAGFEPIEILPFEAEIKVDDLVLAAGFGKTTNSEIDGNLKLNKSGKLKIVEDWGTYFMVDQTKGSGICSGDSGGPTFFDWKGKMYLAGINHAVFADEKNPAAKCTNMGAMVKIQTHKSWVQRHIVK